MRTLLRAAALIALSPCPHAQRPVDIPKLEKAESDEALRRRIDDRIQHMRKSIDEGLPITTNVQVTVWLRNQYRLRGVVKGGRFVEKMHGLDFVAADMQTPGAGIRVRDYDNTNSYIFLPFEGISRYKIGARLTEVDIKKIEQEIETRRKTAEEKRQAALAQLAARQAGKEGKDGADAETDAEVREREKEEARLLALLDEFPPDDGWGPEKVKEIERAKIVIGAFPDEPSKRFLEVFGEWEKAVQLKEAKEAAEREAEAARRQGGSGSEGSEGEGPNQGQGQGKGKGGA